MEIGGAHGRSAAARDAVKKAEKLRQSKKASGAKKAKGGGKKAQKDTGPREPCLCGCGGIPSGKKSRFMQGHDARLKGMAQRFALGDGDVKLTRAALEFCATWEKLDPAVRSACKKAL